jgi:Tfp pilus assembly protein PilO
MAFNYKTDIGHYKKYYRSLEPILKKTYSRANISIIFSFLAVSLFTWYAIRPTMQTILYLRREIADNTVINKQMEDKISSLIEAQSNYQEIEPILPYIDQAIPKNPEAVPLIIQLRNLASTSGVLLTSLQPASAPLVGQDDINQKAPTSSLVSLKQKDLDISLSIQGPFENIRSYLAGIISMRRVVTITGIVLSPVKEEKSGSPSATASNNMLQLAIQLKTYYLIE